MKNEFKRTEAEFKEFEPRLKYGWFHSKLYSIFQDLSRHLIETGFWLKFIKSGLGVEYAREGGEHETCCSTKEESTQGRQGTRQRAESDSGQIREEFFYI